MMMIINECVKFQRERFEMLHLFSFTTCTLIYKCNSHVSFSLHFQGANFRDLPGVIFGADKKVRWDPNVERVYLPSGKPLVMPFSVVWD